MYQFVYRKKIAAVHSKNDNQKSRNNAATNFFANHLKFPEGIWQPTSVSQNHPALWNRSYWKHY